MILTNIKEQDVSQLSVLACLINDFIWKCNTFMQVIMWMEQSEIIYILVIIRAVWFFSHLCLLLVTQMEGKISSTLQFLSHK